MKYPTGSYITKDGERRKILGEAGEVRFISSPHKYESMEIGLCVSVNDLERLVWIEEAPKWEPKLGDKYFFIISEGRTDADAWSDYPEDFERKAFLGVFKTEEAAEARLKEIKEKLGI